MISEKPLFFANAKFKLYLERYSTGKYGWCYSELTRPLEDWEKGCIGGC